MKQIIITIFGYLLVFVNGSSTESEQGDYIKYHKYFAQVEESITDEEFINAESKLDSLFGNYEVKFAKDYLIAAQISLINEHKDKGIEYLKNALKMGVKIKCLKSIKLLNDKVSESEWISLKNEEIQLRKEYLKSINLELYQEFHKRYQNEQDAKGTHIYKSVVYSNFNRIKRFIESDDFVGENLIGLDNQILAKSISDCGCGNSKIIVTLLHYDYPISEIGEEKLISEIKKGNLHPREFATIYNFERNRVSVLYKKSYKKYKELSDYEFNFPFGKRNSDIKRVNSDRQRIGICKYEVDKKKNDISQKYGMKLHFSYR